MTIALHYFPFRYNHNKLIYKHLQQDYFSFNMKEDHERVSFTQDQGHYENFSNCLLSQILYDVQFQDVTLASDDGKEIGAHKMILSAASTWFRSIFTRNFKSTKHPLIICRGLKFEELQSILEFIYLGKTSVLSDNVNRFLTLSEEFGISGLVSQSSTPQLTEPSTQEFQMSVFDHYKSVKPKKLEQNIKQNNSEDIKKPQINKDLRQPDIQNNEAACSAPLVSVKTELLETLLMEETESMVPEHTEDVKGETVEGSSNSREAQEDSSKIDNSHKSKQQLQNQKSPEKLSSPRKPRSSMKSLSPKQIKNQLKSEISSPSLDNEEINDSYKSGDKISSSRENTKKEDTENLKFKKKTSPKKSQNAVKSLKISPKSVKKLIPTSENQQNDRPIESEKSQKVSPKSAKKSTPKQKKPIKNEPPHPTLPTSLEAVDTITEEVTIKEENFYAHLNETIVDPELSKLGKFDQSDGHYNCDTCDYKSESKKHVFVHKMSKHIKLKFECDVCENTFTDPRSLKKHKSSAHEDVKYECDMCERTTNTAYHLASHKRRKHSA